MADYSGTDLGDTYTGTSGDDSIAGLGGDDTLSGDAGNDRIDGGTGNDQLDGGIGNDLMSGAEGNDIVNGGEGDDTLYGYFGNDTVHGGDGNDLLFGGNGQDVIYGDAGADTLNGGRDSDIMFGGDGNDTFYEAGDYSDPNQDGLVYGVPPLGDDEMHGGAGDDAFWGGGSALRGDGSWVHDSYYGDEGNDWFYELAGEVTLDAGSGDDYVVLSSSRGSADGGDDSDAISFAAYREEEWLASANGGPVPLSYVIDLSNLWSGGSGTITSSQGTMNLSNFEQVGFINLDYAMDVAGGDDVVIIGPDYQGNIGSLAVPRQDISSVGVGLGRGDDKYIGGSGTDVVDGGTGNDELHGGAGFDGLIGGEGDDILDGGTGADNMIGGAGNDTYYVDNAPYDDSDGYADIVSEGVDGGIDTVITSVSIRVIYGVSGGLQNIEVIRTSDEAGTTAIDITGNELENTITGNAGTNVLEGLAGDDLLTGGLGDDTLTGGDGVDTANYAGLAGAVTVDLSLTGAQDTGAGGIDTLSTVENLVGTSFGDALTGNLDANSLTGGEGIDTLDGGAGSDTASYADAVSAVTVNLALAGAQNTGGAGVDTLISIEGLAGSAFNDTLRGSSESNDLTGADGDDILIGNAGNDTLAGGDGFDRMYGGVDDDTYVVTDATDFAYENVGDGHDTVVSSTDHTLRANVEDLVLTGLASFGKGNLLDNAVTGTDNANKLYGYEGNDTLNGQGGDDYLLGADGNDTLTGGAGYDRMYGGIGDDTYYVNDTTDFAYENASEGSDRAISSIASYQLRANVEDLQLEEGSAAVRGYGNELDNLIIGNSGNNVLYGRDGNDTVRGASGNDIVYGETGNDTLEGGSGSDRFYGGAGKDKFVFRDGDFGGMTSGTADRIHDFSEADHDLIHLGNVDANALVAGDQSFSFIGSAAFSHAAGELRAYQLNGITWVQGDLNGDGAADFLIRVDGLHTLSATDFVL